MTKLLIIVNESDILLQEQTLTPEELAQTIRSGQWHPPAGCRVFNNGKEIACLRFGELVMVLPRVLLQDSLKIGLCGDSFLSRRQRQVLQGLTQGLTIEQIALRLKITPRMVRKHLRILKDRLGAGSIAQAVSRAALLGLLDWQ